MTQKEKFENKAVTDCLESEKLPDEVLENVAGGNDDLEELLRRIGKGVQAPTDEMTAQQKYQQDIKDWCEHRIGEMPVEPDKTSQYVEDFMKQYNSYLEGANDTIKQSNQTLADLARLR